MKFSVLTLSFNQGNYIREAIDSVLQQNTETEYIIYDPGSKDESRKIIDSFKNIRVNSYYVDGDLGPADGLNRGLELITGDIFYYLNADDRLLPNVFTYVEHYFMSHPECDILHGSIRLIDSIGNTYKNLPSMKFSLLGYALGYSVVYQQATFFRKNLFHHTKFNLLNLTCWDGELIVDMALAGARIHQTEKILGEFRIYAESITGSGRLKNQQRSDHERIARKILGRSPRHYEILFGYAYGKLLALRRRLIVRKVDS